MTTTRTAIVTGGARGLGEAIAGRLVSDGCNVAIWDLDIDTARAAAERLTGERTVLAIECDQADPDSVAHATDATKARFDNISILVNNAGITGPNTTTVDYPVEEWIRVIEVDLIGVYLCCKWVVPLLVDADWGRVVNIASVAGKEGNPNASAYSAAKGGVIALTKSLAKELIGTGVIVNCITPAAVRTRLFDQMSEEHIRYMLEKIPMGRFGLAEEIAALASWLCSDACSFSTGAVFDISGGRATY